MFRSDSVASVHPGGETRKKHNEGREEERNHGRQDSPHSDGVIGVASASVPVDVILDDAEEHEVGGHYHERDDPGYGCHERGQQGAAETSAKREEESNKCEAARDGVEDHDAGEGFRRIYRCGFEGGVVDLRHDACGVISNHSGVAVVLIGPIFAI